MFEGVGLFDKKVHVVSIGVNYFLQFGRDVQGRTILEFFYEEKFNAKNKRYPTMGSPCLHPLPTLIQRVGKPFMRIEVGIFPANIFRGEAKMLRVFSINFKEILTKAFKKSF